MLGFALDCTGGLAVVIFCKRYRFYREWEQQSTLFNVLIARCPVTLEDVEIIPDLSSGRLVIA